MHAQNHKIEDTGCLSTRINEGEGAVHIFQFKSLVFMDQILLYEPSLLQCLKSSLSSSSYSFIPTPAQSEASALVYIVLCINSSSSYVQENDKVSCTYLVS